AIVRLDHPGEVDAAVLWEAPPAQHLELALAEERVLRVKHGDRHANERPRGRAWRRRVAQREAFHRAVGIILQCSHEGGFSHSAALSGSGAYATSVSLHRLMMVLTMSAIGPKRTWAGAVQMYAFDPKRTWSRTFSYLRKRVPLNLVFFWTRPAEGHCAQDLWSSSFACLPCDLAR